MLLTESLRQFKQLSPDSQQMMLADVIVITCSPNVHAIFFPHLFPVKFGSENSLLANMIHCLMYFCRIIFVQRGILRAISIFNSLRSFQNLLSKAAFLLSIPKCPKSKRLLSYKKSNSHLGLDLNADINSQTTSSKKRFKQTTAIFFVLRWARGGGNSCEVRSAAQKLAYNGGSCVGNIIH